jgi:membrane fusion protein (multidrug efflux system)
VWDCGTQTRQRGFRPVADALAAAIVGLSLLASTVALGSPETSAAVIPERLEFQGRIEAVHRAEVSTRIDGRVKGLLFEGGEQVDEGQPLIELASAGLALQVTAAQAEADGSAARLALAQQEAARLRELTGRNAASEAELQDREASLAIAHAEVAMAKAALEQAKLRLENATIRAPIAGIVSRPRIAPGSFVEAKEGDPLATIVRLDPVFVVYQVPYAVRLQSIERSRAASLEALFERISLQLVLPGGQPYPHGSKPDFASAVVDPQTDTINIWARVPNPDGLLRPGMRVGVLSSIEGITEGVANE